MNQCYDCRQLTNGCCPMHPLGSVVILEEKPKREIWIIADNRSDFANFKISLIHNQ